MQIEHKKNTAYYLAFPMVDSTTPASFKTGLSPTDTAYSKDGAGAWSSLAITDTTAEIASTGVYEIDLTAAEMNHDQVLIKFTAAGAADTAFLLDMRTKLVSDLNDIAVTDILSDSTAFAGANVLSTSDWTAQRAGYLDELASANIPTDIDSLVTQIGTAGDGLSAIPWNANWDTEVESECNDALVALDLDHLIQVTAGVEEPTDGSYLDQIMHKDGGQTYDATTDSLEAIRDRGDAAWITGSGGDATAANQSTIITHLTDVKGTGFAKDTHSLPQCLTATGFSTHTAANVRTEMDANSTQLSAIVADTNELQIDWADGGRLDVILDAVLVDTGTTIPGLISGLNDPSSADIAGAVWDEVLTGVTHNVVNSGGRRLRQLQEAGTYAGCIWIDTVNGTGGTTSFENGTDSKPVNNMADANTLATNLGISTFCIAPGSSHQNFVIAILTVQLYLLLI
jgi:hypothetical protein